MSLIFSPGGLSVSYMRKLRLVRAWPTAAFVVAAALLASVLVASPAASATPTGFVCDNEIKVGERPLPADGIPTDGDADDYAKHARIVITRIDPLLGEVRHSSPVVQFRLDARPDGHRPPDSDRPYATGRYLEQAKRSAENNWGTVEVHCSETAFTVVDKEIPCSDVPAVTNKTLCPTGNSIFETRKVIATNGVDHLADGIVRVAIGVTWLVDCATSDFVESQFVDERGRPKPGPLADYDTIKVCGNHYGRGSKVQVNRNTGEFTCKDPDFTGVPNCTTPVQPPTTTTVQPQVAGGSANGDKQGSPGGTGDIGAIRAPGSPPDEGPSAPGETPRPRPEASSDGGSTFGGYVDPEPEPEPDPEPVSLLDGDTTAGGTTSGGYVEPDPPPATTTTVPGRTVEEEHNDAKDEDNDGCLNAQEYRAAINSIAQETSTNWGGMSANDAYRDAHSRRC